LDAAIPKIGIIIGDLVAIYEVDGNIWLTAISTGIDFGKRYWSPGFKPGGTTTKAACAALAVTRVARATPETIPSCFIFMKRKGLMVDDLSA